MKDFLEALTNNLLNADWLNFLALIITVIVSLIISSGERLFGISRDRHEKLIAPLFILLEPNLYKKYDKNLVCQALKIIDENIILADGRLLDVRDSCKRNPEKGFLELCRYIDKAYDKSCRKLKLKTRSILYRITTKQYENKCSFVLHLAIFIIEHAVLFIVIGFIFLCLLAVAANISITLLSFAPIGVQFLIAIIFLISVAIYIQKS